MTTIKVVRGEGGQKDPNPIYEPLANGITALKVRGEQELDAKAYQMLDISITIPFREGVSLGQLVSYQNKLAAMRCVGRITGISISAMQTDLITMTLSLEHP